MDEVDLSLDRLFVIFMDWFQRGVGAFVLIIDTVYILVCDLASQTVIGSYGIKKDCNCNKAYKSDILTPKIMILWNVTPCSWVEGFHFYDEGSGFLSNAGPHQPDKIWRWASKPVSIFVQKKILTLQRI
jgi:hypothetical protein